MGKPIIHFSIETALESNIFDRVLVSTEDAEIAEVARAGGAEVMWRPKELAENDVGTQTVMQNALKRLFGNLIEKDTACVIYATAPMLQPETLRVACWTLDHNIATTPYVVPVAKWLHDPGQFYFGAVAAFVVGIPLTCGARIMPIDPKTACDINIEADWIRAEEMYVSLHQDDRIAYG